MNGWICPRCNAVNAPTIAQCRCSVSVTPLGPPMIPELPAHPMFPVTIPLGPYEVMPPALDPRFWWYAPVIGPGTWLGGTDA